MARHFGKRNALGCFRVAHYAAGIVVGNKTLRDHIEEADRNQEENSANHDRQRAVLEDNLQGPAIAAHQPLVSSLRLLPPPGWTERGHLARILLPSSAPFCWDGGRPVHILITSAFLHGGATAPFAFVIAASMSYRLQQTTAQHRGQAQRYKTRNQNRYTDRDRELPKEPAENSTEKQHRN